MKIIIAITLFLITFFLSMFGINKGENSRTVFQEKQQLINVKTNLVLKDETKK
ncbi:hypothetical protein VSP10_15515 [Myroides odoratimimus]|uniref:Uncharacterized protein n=1 Tax=Myroides odoratimimus CIP 101113 TaxID=883154 RepID=A0AAV3F249_9FLAO|nr:MULTISPECIES: hypothetical protein [Myroides]AJA70242.1 hypothetical protein MYRA21_3141 [Myroides sp. A21]EHO11392.1 hypothetical protein HMPREF9715_02094 [Myroides odoratimimus CIP 101113]EKB06424.1 hypothetical protein HMPREF9711_00796 [Myroides odoratimimus CCUG 3837]MDM1086178.1 hypothetical protein [Myroides odoratimimus]MEC4054188.1 hypothetical protein [Myroides odoratimimus]